MSCACAHSSRKTLREVSLGNVAPLNRSWYLWPKSRPLSSKNTFQFPYFLHNSWLLYHRGSPSELKFCCPLPRQHLFTGHLPGLLASTFVAAPVALRPHPFIQVVHLPPPHTSSRPPASTSASRATTASESNLPLLSEPRLLTTLPFPVLSQFHPFIQFSSAHAAGLHPRPSSTSLSIFAQKILGVVRCRECTGFSALPPVED